MVGGLVRETGASEDVQQPLQEGHRVRAKRRPVADHENEVPVAVEEVAHSPR